MNYIGSKYSLLSFLETSIEEVSGYKNGENYIFGDLFAGTGIVGQTYKAKGCTVIANDIQYYSYVLNKHVIENIPEMDTSMLERLNNLAPVEGFIYKNYCYGSGSGRNYFTDDNGMKSDAIRIELEDMHETGEISDNIYFYYLASLVNSIDKYANTASVYGAFLKHIKKSAKKGFQLELLPVISGKVGTVYNEDINKLVKKVHGDVLYLAPLKYIFLSYNNEGVMTSDTIRKIMSGYGEYCLFTSEYKRFKADKDGNGRRWMTR